MVTIKIVKTLLKGLRNNRKSQSLNWGATFSFEGIIINCKKE